MMNGILNFSEKMKIDYNGIGDILRSHEGYAGASFADSNKPIIYKPTAIDAKYIDHVNEFSIVTHNLFPNQDQIIKTDLLMFILGIAAYGNDNNGKAFDPEIDKKDDIIVKTGTLDLPKYFVDKRTYNKLIKYMSESLSSREPDIISTKLLQIKDFVNNDNLTLVFKNDYLKFDLEDTQRSMSARNHLRDTMKRIKKDSPNFWLVGIHTNYDYYLGNILNYHLEHIVNEKITDKLCFLDHCDSIYLNCLVKGERTALIKNPHNKYTLTFYCKPHEEYYSLKIDIYVNDNQNKESQRNADFIADIITQYLEDRSHPTLEETSARKMAGPNKLIPISMYSAYDKLRGFLYVNGNSLLDYQYEEWGYNG